MKFIGTIVHVSNLITYGSWENKNTKIVACFESNEAVERPDKIAIDFLGDKKEEIAGFDVGDLVEVYFNAQYNRYDKPDIGEVIYNSLRGRKMVLKEKWTGQVTNKPNPDDNLPF